MSTLRLSYQLRKRTMRTHGLMLGAAVLAVLSLSTSLLAQCNAPELVPGADKYNDLVCKAWSTEQHGDKEKALELWLDASKQPVLESPNIRLFGKIATLYAKLGRFREADRYLMYDNLSILWMIGIVRCKQEANLSDESLLKDGKPLTSVEAKDMVDVLCGPVFDEFSYFRDRDAASFAPAAHAILQFEAVRKEINALRHSQAPGQGGK